MDYNTPHASDYESRQRPRQLVIFDSRPGGTGISHAAFQRGKELVRCALKRVQACPCSVGCPLCIQDMRNCSEHNQRICKPGATIVLDSVWELTLGEAHDGTSPAGKPTGVGAVSESPHRGTSTA